MDSIIVYVSFVSLPYTSSYCMSRFSSFSLLLAKLCHSLLDSSLVAMSSISCLCHIFLTIFSRSSSRRSLDSVMSFGSFSMSSQSSLNRFISNKLGRLRLDAALLPQSSLNRFICNKLGRMGLDPAPPPPSPP